MSASAGNAARFRSPLLQQLIRNAAQQQQYEGSSKQLGSVMLALASSSTAVNASEFIGRDSRSSSSQKINSKSVTSKLSIRSHSGLNFSSIDNQEKIGDEIGSLNKNGTEHEMMQNLIRSRRTISRFQCSSDCYESHEFLKTAIERAVKCGMNAPNHKRTEPFTFKRMIAPSNSTEKLAEIAFNVARSTKGENIANSKREKWRKIPAFLVATVGHQPKQHQRLDASAAEKYTPFDTIMPETERQLEDYASSCAAVQNTILSLHSEGLGSKWATGPIIRTPAFRELVGVVEDEIVVALIMIGFPKKIPKEPKRRRELQGDILQDI